ncbi:aromatic ring-hydroxylating dioxygenase subunit alpha [Comamonas sp. Y33R10-2]|uniref:aromatic ring-hydroxylating oxygenase subunit alpha n=1 Tax=Comamonas sp. Y33R10-2 TaxID=2853257 RepID=UPI001C5C854F|nr:aromatic ring-hydroxylating dioxygenase subunit alpha [Comamonas sp. Y33R10-2]QXZ08385.1 aromatic ring-hydroxylating dioxygenase subunit alpha [Comamonas sp. Y33R10-2]
MSDSSMSYFPSEDISNADQQLLEKLQELARPGVRATHAMPGEFYTSPAFAEIERTKVFRRNWVCVGHTGEIPTKGDYYTTDVAGEPLIVQRDGSGEVRVMANVCRHRGNLVATGRGNKKLHVCAYHAWTFELDGKLKRAPLMQDSPFLDTARCALPTIATTVWQNFIFVNLDGNAPPLAQSLAPLETHIRNYHHEERELYHSTEEVWQTNWKCLAENFMEGYHLNATHPRTLRPVTPTELCEYVEGNGHFSAYRAHYTPDSSQRAPHHPELSADERRFSFLFSVFPNLVVTYMPHQTVYLCLRPKTVDSVAVRWGIAGHEQAPDEASVASYVAFADAFNAEDRTKLETLQTGLHSSFYNPGPLACDNLEGTLRDFYAYIGKQVIE